MKFKRYAIIGSGSFAGTALLTRLITDGHEVIGFNRSAPKSSVFQIDHNIKTTGSYRFYQTDINKDLDVILNLMDQFCPEVVIDFAGQGMVAESWDSPEQWYTTNLVAKVKFHDKLRKRSWLKRYIRISTPEVYGSNDNKVKENWLYNPSTPYAVSHAAVDMSLRAFHQRYEFPVIFTRFANFYGPGQQLYRIIPRTIIYGLLGKNLELHGGGTSIRSFIYSSDVADGIVRTISNGRIGDVYHFAAEQFFTIRVVVEMIFNQMGIDFNDLVKITPDRPGKDLSYLMDSTKARSDLGWKDSVTFEQGIHLTKEWVKASLDEIRSLPLEYIHKI